jgi:hypothetical protein
VRDVEFDENTVTVELPPRTRFSRVARTLAAACCAVEGLSADTMADVRLLVDEVFHALSSVTAGPIRIMLTPRRGRVLLSMFAPPRPGSDWDAIELPLLEAIAAVMVTDPVFGVDDELVRFTAVLRDGPATP